ncbi:hypothetical protein HPB49_016869 [Dermacentor silvarum]|uniref:Uncharacterized protein n=1 Tax=Dermacentor silvarum TaxID=543639 RepID=A0ACB8CM17_DERSI|nr:hypothetical protein HPB49_016869 [Dermacentor silvarum]
MVLKDIATSIDHLATSSINHQIVTILPQKHSKARTIITNVYSPPKEKRADFEALIRYVKAHSSTQDRLLLLGDFNATHTSWGYRTDTPKGRELERAVEAYDLQLIILPQNPTRLGNSVSADTFPDLTFTNNVDEVFWTNLEENLGSDHFILSVSAGSPKIRRACGHVVITDWVNYRKVPMPQILPENAEDWATHIRDAHKATSKRIALTAETPVVDSHLLHMWEGRRGITKRWKKQRLNRKLRHRIAEISERANAYAQQLEAASWASFCDSLRETLHTSKTWAILRSIMEPGKTKTATNRTLQKLAGEFPGTEQALLTKLKDKYVGEVTTPPCILPYKGQENAVLDAPITKAELFAATQAAKRNTAPGPDQLTNAMIRNLKTRTLLCRSLRLFGKNAAYRHRASPFCQRLSLAPTDRLEQRPQRSCSAVVESQCFMSKASLEARSSLHSPQRFLVSEEDLQRSPVLPRCCCLYAREKYCVNTGAGTSGQPLAECFQAPLEGSGRPTGDQRPRRPSVTAQTQPYPASSLEKLATPPFTMDIAGQSNTADATASEEHSSAARDVLPTPAGSSALKHLHTATYRNQCYRSRIVRQTMVQCPR